MLDFACKQISDYEKHCKVCAETASVAINRLMSAGAVILVSES